MKYFFFISLAVLLHSNLRGQDRLIRGEVRLAGIKSANVNVYSEGTTIGTSTNSEGSYSLSIPQNTETLTFSFLGYETRSEEIDVRNVINVNLAEDANTLDQIIVRGFPGFTAKSRKRQESVQSIPESIVIYNSDEITRSGIESIPDFIEKIPNASFTSSQNIGTHALTVRGISQIRNGEAPVAIVIDGINVSTPNGIDMELFDIEQMELVKGPQGALYGRNAIGGALNITTKRPTDEFNHFVKLGYGNGNSYRALMGSSGPIVKEKLLYRVGTAYKNSDGLITNTFTDKKVDFYEDISVRGQLLLNISDHFNADIIGNYSDTQGGATYNVRGCDPLLNSIGGCHSNVGQLSPNNTSLDPISDEPGISNRAVSDLSLRINYGLPFAKLTSLTAFSQVDSDFSGDFDFSPLREIIQEQRLNTNSISQEIRLTSNISDKFNWIVGGFYQTVDREINTIGSLSSAGFFAGILGLPGTAPTEQEILFPIVNEDNTSSNETTAFFGQASYTLKDKTEFSLGLRYDRDIREQTDLTSGLKRKHTFNEWQPKFNLSHAFTEDFFVFASYGRGYRSGGFNSTATVRYPVLYDAEKTNNYEIGIKSSFLDNRLVANLSAFQIDFMETQIFLIELDGGGVVIANLGETRNTGIELDLKYRPIENLDIYAAIGVINPEIIDNGTDIPDSLNFALNFEKNFVPQVNLNSTLIAVQYTLPFNEFDIWLRAEHEHRGKLYWHPSNLNPQSSKEFVNLSANYTNPGNVEWSIRFFVDNLLNTDYTGEFLASEFSNPLFGDLRWPGQPTTYGIDLSFKF